MLQDNQKLAEWLKKNASIDIAIEPEMISIVGNASAIDEVTDKATEKHIQDELDSGNTWAWCSVQVSAKYAGIEASDYLGGCSYQDEADFKAGGYYADMVDQACYVLAGKLMEARIRIKQALAEI